MTQETNNHFVSLPAARPLHWLHTQGTRPCSAVHVTSRPSGALTLAGSSWRTPTCVSGCTMQVHAGSMQAQTLHHLPTSSSQEAAAANHRHSPAAVCGSSGGSSSSRALLWNAGLQQHCARLKSSALGARGWGGWGDKPVHLVWKIPPSGESIHL